MPDHFADGCEMTDWLSDTGAFFMTSNKPAFIVPGGHGAAFNIGSHIVTEKVTCEQSGGDYYVIQQVSPPGSFVPPHVHSLEDEIVFIDDGEFEIFLGGKTSRAGPGAVLHFARGTYHGFKIVGERSGKSTWVITPGTSFQAFFREVAAFPPGPPDFAKLDALHAKHGMIMPPPA
jgi:quercetin dioxygenase-like cupin family protein